MKKAQEKSWLISILMTHIMLTTFVSFFSSHILFTFPFYWQSDAGRFLLLLLVTTVKPFNINGGTKKGPKESRHLFGIRWCVVSFHFTITMIASGPPMSRTTHWCVLFRWQRSFQPPTSCNDSLVCFQKFFLFTAMTMASWPPTSCNDSLVCFISESLWLVGA